MIQRTIHTASLFIVSLLLMLTAGKNAGASVSHHKAEINRSEQQRIVLSAFHHAEALAILSSVHHLPTFLDVVETTETKSEDDDEIHAHKHTITAPQDCFPETRLARSPLADCPQSCSIPLYVLHHSWKHFVSPVLA
jgi:hypothetical protein